MRYHWGMGIGHIHAHGLAEVAAPAVLPSANVLLAEVEVEHDVGLDNG